MRLDFPFREFTAKEEYHLRSLIAEAVECDVEDIIVVDKWDACTGIRIRFGSPAERDAFYEDARRDNPRIPAVRLLLSYFRLERIELVPDDGRRPLHIPPVMSKPQRGTATWLHLSDLHMCAGERPTAGAWDQDVVTASFLQRLPELLKQHDLHPDAVLFTGDASQSAADLEYEAAGQFFGEVRARVGRDVPILAVPGNHDVSWATLDQSTEKSLIEFTNRSNGLLKLMLGEEGAPINDALCRLDSYVSFWRSLNSDSLLRRIDARGFPSTRNGRTARAHAWFTAKIPIWGDSTIGVAGLNSVLASRSKLNDERDEGRLALGEPQLALGLRELKDASIRLALVHHPLDSSWYRAKDRASQRAFIRDVDFVLSGHEHDLAELVTSDTTAASPSVTIAAGAVFQGRKRAQSFNAVRLDREQGTATIYAWTFGTANRWVPDVNRWDDGFCVLPLPKSFLDHLRQGPAQRDLSFPPANASRFEQEQFSDPLWATEA